MANDRTLDIISRYDKALKNAEDKTLERVYRALDSAYLSLEKQLLKSYQQHSHRKDLLPRQRLLLILSETKDYLSLINPSSTGQYEQAFYSLIQKASEMGTDLSGQLTQAIANEQLQTFATVPLDAVRLQAQESAKRLYRWSEEYQQKISGVVEMHLAVGSGSRKVARALRTELGLLKGRAEMIARTETLSSLNRAAQENYQKNNISYTQVQVTRDDRLCSTCAARSGNVYRLGEISVPLHGRCRCMLLPWSKSWQQAGLTNDDWHRQFRSDVLNELKQSGKKPQHGLSPFEKSNGLTEPPKPIWEP